MVIPGTPAQAIIGGRTVQADSEYPAVGRLLVPYAGGKELCTAILIRTDVALTAKHCFTARGYDSKNGPITLRFGSRMASSGGQVREATSFVLGDGFDLALIQFPSVTGIRPLPLVTKAESALYKNGTVALIVGWGGTASGEVAKQLQEGALKIEDQVYSLPQTIKGYNYLMKASPYSGKIAGGDSGGPLINEHVDNGAVLQTVVGVLSQGSKGDAAAYTKVGSTRPWIMDYLNRTPVIVPEPAQSVPTPVPVPANKAPSASFTATRLTGAGNMVMLDGTVSKDPDGTIRSWQWLVDGAAVQTGSRVTVALGAGVSKSVTLRVTDDKGAAAAVTRTILTPNRAPVISATVPADGAFSASTTPTLSVTASDPDTDALQLSYRVTGPSVDVSSGWVSGSWTVPTQRLDPGTTYELTATVKDAGGLTATRKSTFTVAMLPTAADVVATSTGAGYWQVDTYGNVFAFGDAPSLGTLPSVGVKVNNVIGMARTPSSRGYWLVGSDGGVFSFGDAPFFGSMGGKPLNAPVVGMAPTRTGKGYWLAAADGGVFAFGDAGFYGSMGGKHLNGPVTAIAPTVTGNGYWLSARDGGIFSFGDAQFFGSMGGKQLNAPVVDMDTTPDGRGYWMTAEDGGVFAFGNARFYGSMAGQHLNGHVTGMAATADGGGYWLNACDGGIFSFGNATFRGSHPTFQCRGIG
ncbi:S1 family peptidase [Paractinoplanes toevensis]|uniref:S1 family peptidase n=1 Tax=Paractinoplanes toevensis TaxID=571911 RepID=UPI001BB3851B|nr:trypsin-like serine protease [Actinoplanes toevensis]